MIFGAISFWYQAGLNAVGPLVTAVIGLLIVGLAVNRYTRTSQDRRIDNELKYALISEITDTASTFYHHLAMFDRANASGEAGRNVSVDTDETPELRKKVQEQYPPFMARADVLEERLEAYFADTRVALAWHAVRDCLSIKYHYAIQANNGEQVIRKHLRGYDDGYHSGVSVKDREDMQKVTNVYQRHLKITAKLIFACPLRQRRSSQKAKREVDRVLKQDKDINFDYK